MYMYDVDCPYCDAEQEINHEHDYGYKEDVVHEQECGSCGKTFVYTTSIHVYHDAERGPCKNGGAHDWKPVVGSPAECFVGRERCSVCDERRTLPTKEANLQEQDADTESLDMWVCGMCGHYNLMKNKTCFHCGGPRSA